jgi:hypothetical protein
MTPIFLILLLALSRAASAGLHPNGPKVVAAPGQAAAGAKAPVASIPTPAAAAIAGAAGPKAAHGRAGGSSELKALAEGVRDAARGGDDAAVEGSLDRGFSGSAPDDGASVPVESTEALAASGDARIIIRKRQEPAPARPQAAVPAVSAAPARLAAPWYGRLYNRLFTSKEARRAQERDAFFLELKQAADAGDAQRLGGGLSRVFEYQDEPQTAAAVEAVIDAQERRGPREAMGTAIYLTNGARSPALVRSLVAKSFPLIERADKGEPLQMADAAMLSGVIASASGITAADRTRARASWRMAMRSLNTEAGIGHAFAAASNAVLGDRDRPVLRAEGLMAWEALVVGLARENRDAAVKEALRVRDGYDGFGDYAVPFRSRAAAILIAFGYEDPPPVPRAPADKVADLLQAFAQQPREALAWTISRASAESPAEYRAALRAALESLMTGEPRLQRHLTALDENGDGKVSLRESYRALRAMRFGRLKAAIIAFGSQSALVASTGRVGWFSFAVAAGPSGLHRTVDTGAMDPEQDLAKKLDLFMAEDLDGDGFVDLKDVGRLIDNRAQASKAGKLAVFFVKAASKAEFAALFQLTGGKMSRDDLRDFYTGSLFFSLLTPDALAQRIVGLRARP